MIGERRVVALVVGRGGSKGLPGKNVALCGGRPLVAWSVAAAKACRYADRVIVSSDDADIIAVARSAGAEAPFVRPPELANDDATMDAVVAHALDAIGGGFDVGVLLQATSPLRTAADIDDALELFERESVPSVVSVTEAAKSPYWMFELFAKGEMRPLFPELSGAPRRQSLPAAYALNGAIYVFDVDAFMRTRRFVTEETRAFVMPAERSVDVDTAIDLAVADLLLKAKQGS